MKVILLMAQTLDGKIAKTADHFPDWTGRDDKRLFVEMTHKAGVVIMGSKTFDTIGKPLPGRKNIVMTRNAQKMGVWGNLTVTGDSPQRILQNLEAEGYEEVMIIGGATINTLFVQNNLIDEIVLTISPFIFGQGLALFREDVSLALQFIAVRQLGEDRILATYRIQK